MMMINYSLSCRPVWNFAGHVVKLSKTMLSVHWKELTTHLALSVRRAANQLESRDSLRERMAKCIASRITTGKQTHYDTNLRLLFPTHSCILIT